MEFVIKARRDSDGAEASFVYNNMTSELYDGDGKKLSPQPATQNKPNNDRRPNIISKDMPGKKGEIRTLKIQLGLSCNYECTYCSQRFVPRADETANRDVEPFVAQLDTWLKTKPQRIEFWGGEPLVYIKTLKPLAEALRAKFPDVPFMIITNGSLLNPEINEWLERTGFNVGISHDGPGQWQRGPDPLEDADSLSGIQDLWRRLRPQGRISFNAMLTVDNYSRAEIEKFFKNLTGDGSLNIGEGSFIDPYDVDGARLATASEAERYAMRKVQFDEIREYRAMAFGIVQDRMREWIDSVAYGRLAETLGQKCGMDREDAIAVDLKGNVLTCQNVSHVATGPNGESHKIGHVSDFENIAMRTSTHWSKRPHCASCPMLQGCKGSCMFLDGDLWWTGCESAYNDHIPFFAAAFEAMTGYKPLRIEGDGMPEHRMNIWGEGKEVKQRKVIPIMAAGA